MPTYTPPKTLGDLLLVEVAPGWTKETGTLLASTVYELGQVLARVDGKYLVLAPLAADGSEIAVAVLGEAVDAGAADAPGLLIARGAVLESGALVWPAGITEPQKASALAQLEARGIVARAAL